MKLGARMLKTGLAVALSLYVAKLIGLPTPIFAAIAAVFSIQPSIYRSYQTMLEQLQANIIGAVIAIMIVFTLGNDPFVIGFAIVLVIGICMSLKMNENTILLAIVAVIAIMETTDMTFLNFAFLRVSSLSLGIFSAFIVNLVFLPPKYETRLFTEIDRSTSDILLWLRITIRHLSDQPSLKGEITRIQDQLRRIDHTYLLFSEERTYFKKRRLSKARKLIIFRQLISTTKKSLDVLKAFYQLDNKIKTIPEEFQTVLVQEVDKVLHSHEKLMLSSMGRIRKQQTEILQEIYEPAITKLVDTLIHIYQDDDEDRLVFLPLASQLMEYHGQLVHLKRLLKSYQQYHRAEQIQIMKK